MAANKSKIDNILAKEKKQFEDALIQEGLDKDLSACEAARILASRDYTVREETVSCTFHSPQSPSFVHMCD